MAVASIRIGASSHADPAAAVAELRQQVVGPDTGLVIVFCSTKYNLDSLAVALNLAFAGIEVIGCTTAGEIGPNGYQQGGLAGIGLGKSAAMAELHFFDNLQEFSVTAAGGAVELLRQRLAARVGLLTPANAFAFLMIDGMAMREEVVARCVHRALEDIPLIGGSAGDALQFRRTAVFYRGQFHSHAAVLALVHSLCPFKAFKTQHFRRSIERMVVTEAIPATRTVTEINGFPAAEEYARMVGLEVEQLEPMIFAAHPVMVKIGDAEYVRSIQRVNPDGSLTFFCAIDTGIVLTVAEGVDVVDNLERTLASVADKIGPPQVVIGCDCILRNLEIRRKHLSLAVSELLARYRVIGFNTYGEQFNGMHVNQTFTAVAIGERR